MPRSLLLFLLLATVSFAAQRPNILLIFTDDHAYQAIGAYGSRINETPNIDRLAREGMRFDRCYVTNSICGPCRATVLTGKYSHKNGYYNNEGQAPFDGSQVTFPKLLQSAGYETALIGKWHLESDPTGFDHWEILDGQGAYHNPKLIAKDATRKRPGYVTEILTELALDWLSDERDAAKPFLLMLQHKAPHRPWEPGPKQLRLYEDQKIPEPASLFEDYSQRGKAVREQDMTIEETMTDGDLKLAKPLGLNAEQLADWNAAYGPHNAEFRNARLQGEALVRWKYQRYIKDYLRCVAAVDDSVGQVLDYLDESGLAEDTIVVYCSDQGFYLGEHGWFDKRWMYEESLRTPLLVRWPGVAKAGSYCDAISSPLDLAETFLDAAGAEVPADMQGRSLRPLLEGETPADWRTSFYYHYYEYPGSHSVRKHYGVTDGRFKLIHFYEPEVNEWELYDLHNDRAEVVNLYSRETYVGVQTKLHAQLARLREELEVPEVDPPESVVRH
jgi:arylsulfatase A-like enzyme